jgi:hypothetical protein
VADTSETHYVQQDIRPVPDPTILTTEASSRLEQMLRNLIKTENEHLHELMNLDVSHQEVLFGQKLAEIKTQLKMLDARTAEQKKDTKDALDAALAAQKEAVAAQTASSEKSITKSETATIERIKAVETLLATSTKASDDKIDDLKVRIVAIEAVKIGNFEQGTTVRGNMANIISVIAVVITTIIAAASIVALILKP